MVVSESRIEMVAEDALNAAVAVIQDSIGVTEGDFAGLFFASDDGEKIRDILKKYMAAELSFNKV